ncbi:hypothetical protein PIROE2DRAFT_15088 [Piromyces sp. E2]|nr:hypothetical protein PIROE2DRAFT_15088 [Piromyces sp. E2]|eukprot:OUM59396.1 hypothetical protein PIROE2DRAFT_15088 [Piromyces sp. E2]
MEYSPLINKSSRLSEDESDGSKETIVDVKSEEENFDTIKNKNDEDNFDPVKDKKNNSSSSSNNEEKNKINDSIKKYNIKCYVVLVVTYIIWAIFYKLSLRGGVIEDFTIDKVFILAEYQGIGFVCYSIYLWVVPFMKISKKKKWSLISIEILSLFAFLIYDHGELFDHHGFYNFLLFILYIIIFDGFALTLYIWSRIAGFKKFLIQFIIINTIISTITVTRLIHYKSIWDRGLLNKKIESGDNLCEVERPLPWFDLFPKGFQNFWTGSQSCSRKEHFEALFDPDQGNKLVVRKCSEKDITFMVVPDSRNFNYTQKYRWELREVVDSTMESKVYHYTEPVELKNVEAVYVTCGDQSKLVTRVAERRVEPEKEEQPIEKLNVLLIFIDALSRHYFLRKLPKTAKKIEEIHNSGISHLNQFFRYNVVDINTFGNTLAMYAGLEGIKYQEYEEKKGVPIWEEYRKRGYVTGLVNDYCEDWDTAYNRRTKNYSLDHELLSPFCLPEYHERYGNPYKNFKGPYSLRKRCITGQYVHNYALNYTRDFIKTYDGTNPWFFFSGYIEAHESTSEVITLMDDDLANFFDSLSEETLNRTAIFVMSDHGLHIGFSYLFSNQGQVEHKLPLLLSLIPQRFLNKYPELKKNLDDNEQKLINGFNIYETLRDILDFDPLVEPHDRVKGGVDISKYIPERNENSVLYDFEANKNEKRNNRHINNEIDEMLNNVKPRYDIPDDDEQENATIIWGKSLLREVPNRTCPENLIQRKYCVCH